MDFENDKKIANFEIKENGNLTVLGVGGTRGWVRRTSLAQSRVPPTPKTIRNCHFFLLRDFLFF